MHGGGTRPGLREILDRLGIVARSSGRLKSGHNLHWLVRTNREPVVLRRYWARRKLAYARFEVEVLRRLLASGWPVPEPLADPLEAGGYVWCVFTHLLGRSRAPRTPQAVQAEKRSRGRLLAEFHQDLAGCSDLGQRDGWVRAEEVFDRRDDGPTLGEVLKSLGRTRPDEARLLSWHADRAQARLKELEAERFPAIVIHGDFAPWNLRYRHGRLSGILDFDLAHLNHRVADFALSWRGHHDDVIVGYDEVTPLSEAEWELILPVWWAWCLAGARDQLIREADSDLSWVIGHISRRSQLLSAPTYEKAGLGRARPRRDS